MVTPRMPGYVISSAKYTDRTGYTDRGAMAGRGFELAGSGSGYGSMAGRGFELAGFELGGRGAMAGRGFELGGRPAGQAAAPSTSAFPGLGGILMIAGVAGVLYFAIKANQDFIKTPHRERYLSRAR